MKKIAYIFLIMLFSIIFVTRSYAAYFDGNEEDYDEQIGSGYNPYYEPDFYFDPDEWEDYGYDWDEYDDWDEIQSARNHASNNTSGNYRIVDSKNYYVPLSKNRILFKGNIYLINDDGTYHKGWNELYKGLWEYYDKETGVRVENKLIEWQGNIYYIEYGFMQKNRTVNICGVDIAIDKDGICRLK